MIVELPFSPPPFSPLCDFNYDRDNEKYRGKDEYETDPRAVILCKIMDGKVFKNAFWAEKQKGGNDTKCYEVSWCELQKLKKRFCE